MLRRTAILHPSVTTAERLPSMTASRRQQLLLRLILLRPGKPAPPQVRGATRRKVRRSTPSSPNNHNIRSRLRNRSHSMRNRSSRPRSRSISNSSSIRIRMTRASLPRMSIRSRNMLPNRLPRCRSTSSRHAPIQTTSGRLDTGPMAKEAITGFPVCGRMRRTPARYGPPATGAIRRAAMDSTAGFGVAILATTEA